MPRLDDPQQWLPRHGDALYRYALLHLRDAALAEELVQETLLAGLESQHNFAGQSSTRTWLVAILKHKMLDHYRRQRREQPEAEPDAQLADLLDLPPVSFCPTATGPSPCSARAIPMGWPSGSSSCWLWRNAWPACHPGWPVCSCCAPCWMRPARPCVRNWPSRRPISGPCYTGHGWACAAAWNGTGNKGSLSDDDVLSRRQPPAE